MARNTGTGRARARGVWRAFAAAYGAAVVAFLLLPDGATARALCFSALGLAAAAAAALGSRRSGMPAAWRWLAFGVACNAAGGLVETIFAPDAYPSIADVFYLGLYPGFIIGLTLMISRYREERFVTSFLDAAVIAVGLGLLSWVFLIHPLAADVDVRLIERATSMVYPIADIVLLAQVIRLALVSSLRTPATRVVFASVTAFLAMDTAWAVLNQIGVEPSPLGSKLLQALSLVAYGLVGVGALLPAAAEKPGTESRAAPRMSRLLLVALTLAALTAPAILLAQSLAGGVTDGVAIAACAAAMYLLVIARMSGLLRQVGRQATRLGELALEDELTGLPNRRALMLELGRRCEQAARTGSYLAVSVIDLDHFKRFNDEFGHVAGDRLLAEVASAWRERLRRQDVLARYGGEEFVVVMPDTDLESATVAVEALRRVVPEGQTCSAGVATWRHADSSGDLIARADAAMYSAKKLGRDRAVAEPDPRPHAPLPWPRAGA
ncbi:MAG TPA: GGDEF domain-containing protein [Thermoleophilia bacterium]|nr:GGDEF domain-containing protein [Thermoleophilia bacterium]